MDSLKGKYDGNLMDQTLKPSAPLCKSSQHETNNKQLM